MTKNLEKVFLIIKNLPESEQNLIANFILEKLETDWDRQLEKDFSEEGSLKWLLEEAETEFHSGKAVDGGFDCR